ncbi:MAG: hypothetical protein QOK31_1756 [Solirubrobacteraceae bacterium]|nr:hypothetical protein [Solirubrobacteraceae bacterium]
MALTLGRRRPAPARIERRTLALALTGLGTTAAVLVVELGRVWRRGSAPLPAETDDVLGAAAEAARQTGEVAREGYRELSTRENALLNLLLSYTLTFGAIRVGTHSIRRSGRFGPFRDVTYGRRHIHHFVPGIALAFLAGGASVASADESLDRWLAVPFGAGLALTLDESALLLELEDVYWTEEGVLSIQVALTGMTLLASLTLARRLLRRGEQRVL